MSGPVTGLASVFDDQHAGGGERHLGPGD